ncbi:MAG: YdcF family protein [Bdellovibrionales bacterium]|nr:YdcF family protein [Bdellovibrionales bacterium]
MILKSKYVFESKGTRMYRHFLSAVIFLVSVFLCYTFVCTILLLDARNEGKNAKATFVQTPPDLIVVFTGGQGRIEFAVKRAQEFKQPNVFITGVHEKNSVKTIMNPIDPEAENETDHIELDYTARNTVENVVSTLKYLRNNRGLNKILIISSDYHIMRIKMIVDSLMHDDEKYEFFFSPVPSNYLSIKSIKILYTEVFKLARTKLFLLYWDGKSPMQNFY